MSENLIPTWVIGSLDLTEYPFSVDRENAVDVGEPEMVVVSTPSQLADGDLERTVRHGNRTYVLPIYIEGPTLADVADAEALLRAELRRTGLTLTHDPGDSWAVPSVYEVQTVRMALSRDDTHESHLIRRWTLTLVCGPWTRSSSAVTVQAIAPPPGGGTPTTASITTADTTTGWSATSLGPGGPTSPAVVDIGDGVSASDYAIQLKLMYALPTPVAPTGTPYVTVDLAGTTPTQFVGIGLDVAVGPMPVAATQVLPTGVVRYYLAVDTTKTLSGLHIVWNGSAAGADGPQSVTFSVYDISRTDTLPSITTHQSARSLEVSGTERSPASINIAPGGSGTSLGWTIVHTTPETLAGYSPALRQFRTSGNTVTSSSTLMSGGREPVNSTPVVAQVPLASLPEGEYAIAALMRSTVVGTFPIFYEARTLLPGIGYLGGTSDTVSATFTATNTWTLIPLDVVTLPPVRSNGAFVQLNLSRTPVAAEVIDLDEWWTLRMGDDCATTILYDNAGFLWLDSPDVSSGVPRIWVGGNSNRSDAHHPSFNLYAQGAHALHPDGTAIFVATSGLEYPNVSATYYPRYHSNAAS